MKVHFAGNGISSEAMRLAGACYRLISFYYVAKKGDTDTPEEWNKYKHLIVDSGLFTFMFGSEAKKDLTMDFCEDWQNKYVKFINETPFRNADFVEMDVQKKLGADAAWHLRRKMKRQINKGGVINVYHLEDGNPDKLIEFSDYIAISLPELRLNVGSRERKQIISYISKSALKKGKRVHILGCTQLEYLKMFSNCTSSDSTSWLGGVRWGRVDTINGRVQIRSLHSNTQENIKNFSERDKAVYRSALFSKQIYTAYAGNQS